MRLDAREKMEQEGVRLRNWSPGSHRTTCPRCSPGRKKKKDECLSVKVDGDDTIAFYCHHCGWSGRKRPGTDLVQNSARLRGKQRYAKPAPEKPKPPRPARRWRMDALGADALSLFARRGIYQQTLTRFRIGQVTRWMPGCEGRVPAIVFPYFLRGKLVNNKYRAVGHKAFIQDPGTLRTVFNIDAVAAAPEVVIVEGEMDVLAMHQSGVPNAVTLPDGAARNGNEKRMRALKESGLMDRDVTFVIAGDTDEPGMDMRKTLVKALGRERCRAVEWPPDPHGEGGPVKDAGDCLRFYNPETVAMRVAAALPCADGHI